MLRVAPSAAIALGLGLGLAAAVALANSLGRDRDPLVLTGGALPDLLGAGPARIVAFRYAGGWVQMPVQVDERAVVDFAKVYGEPNPSGFTFLTYTDTSTFTGPDPDLAFDADDELVLMGKDAGDEQAAAAEPAGVMPGSGVKLTVTNPLTAAAAYAYVFESDGSLDPGAGETRVGYDFVLLSGNYKATYNTLSGPNPENTRVTAASYQVHFADRWIRDEIRVTAAGATGVDILDRHKSLFAPGVCSRSENTFSAGEGAFIVSRSGPLRALRGYVGANSGPTTHRIHAFYEGREDCFTALRVHAIGGIMDFFDYSPAATGMTYRNDLNTGGVTIDGNPDAVTLGPTVWEMVTGAQGTLVMTSWLATNIPAFDYTSYYSDDSTPLVTQCTGDAFEYGASGFREDDPIPNTDPALGAYYVFEATRVMAYDAPGQSLAFAQARAQEAMSPLTATAAPYAPAVSVAGRDLPSGLRLVVEPHPVRGRARLRFSLPAAGRLSLRLYDASGRAVSTLAEGAWPAGRHEVTLDASRLQSGVYFARASLADSPGTAVRLVRVR